MKLKDQSRLNNCIEVYEILGGYLGLEMQGTDAIALYSMLQTSPFILFAKLALHSLSKICHDLSMF